MLATGTRVAGYRIDGILGQGGMGLVYEATQLSLDRKVALKLIAPERGDSDALRERFRLEGLRQAAIDHPHIVTVHEAGETEQGLYFAMQLVRGPTLKELIDGGQLDVARTLRILSQVADALDTAHAAGLIHRDVKPHNILVGARDHAYLADFGLTKAAGDHSLTQTGRFVGTLNYVAPEQIRGEPVTPRTDVYALGAVLFECLTGSVPYRHDSQAAILWAHIALPVPRVSERRPELPAALDAVIDRAMAKEPEARFASTSELLCSAQDSLVTSERAAASPGRPGGAAGRAADADLSTVDASFEGVLSPPQRSSPVIDTPAAQPWPPPRRPQGRSPSRPRAAGVAAVLAALLAGGGYLGGTLLDEPRRANRSLISGTMRLGVPDAWRPTTAVSTIPGLDLSKPAGVLSGERDSRGARLLVGMADGSGSTLLPRTLLDRLAGRPSTKDVVALGRLKAYRYRDLRLRGLKQRLTLFVVPTDRQVATIACLGAGDAGPPAACERAAATLELDGVRALALGARDDYAKALNAVLARLNEVRDDARAALRRTASAKAREGSARDLARAFERADSDLAKVPAGPAERPAHEALRADTRSIASAYTRLASAARRRSASDFRAATESVRGREARFERDLRALGRLGYSAPAEA